MKAIIYCRVSTREQVQNLSLSTQQKACSDYCAKLQIEVDKVFVEEGESAKTTDRTKLKELLDYCRSSKGRVQYLVIYSLSRLARDSHDHQVLRATVAGMKESLKRGRWTFQAPLGYVKTRTSYGPSMAPDPIAGPLVKQALELFATGRYPRVELIEKMRALGLTARNGGQLNQQTFHSMLKNPVYMGDVEVKKWGVRYKGDFQALVSEDVFNAVQLVLSGRRPNQEKHHLDNPDFPLRRFAACGACGEPITGSWSKGRHGTRYAYYRCRSNP